MPRGTRLTDFEKGQILALKKGFVLYRSIADSINRSVGAVQKILKAYHSNERVNFAKKTLKISDKTKRGLIILTCTDKYNANDFKAHLNLSVTTRRIQQILSESKKVYYSKMVKSSVLTADHKIARLNSARRFVGRGNPFWIKVIFSDEKKFNLDGPDGMAFYWWDSRKELQRISACQNGGKSLMFLGAFFFHAVRPLVVTNGRQNAESYCNTLRNNLLSFVVEIFGEQRTWVFQQDNAPIHIARVTRSWLNTHRVPTLPWPARSTDLKIIKNVWRELVRHVYKRERRFQTRDELEANIDEAWASISTDYFFKLYRSMSRRLIQVIEQKGAETRY